MRFAVDGEGALNLRDGGVDAEVVEVRKQLARGALVPVCAERVGDGAHADEGRRTFLLGLEDRRVRLLAVAGGVRAHDGRCEHVGVEGVEDG